MEYLLIGSVALIASLLTFFSGFGLGTMLLPAFALFFPLEYAIALTGAVHLLNNIFKTSLIGAHISIKTLLIFGLPAMVGAYFGSKLLLSFADIGFAYSYTLNDNPTQVKWTQIVVGLLLIVFAFLDKKTLSNRIQPPNWVLPVGGIISGFFGGLSGHQGALRTAFLAQLQLQKETFIATGIAIACVVDLTRLPVYFSKVSSIHNLPYPIMTTAVLCAFIGAFLGKRFLKKITLNTLHNIIAALISITGMAMILGLL